MCDCIKKANEALKNTNTRLYIPIQVIERPNQIDLGADQCAVATERRDPSKREKPKTLFASYCPFCGVKYKEEEPPDTAYLKEPEESVAPNA